MMNIKVVDSTFSHNHAIGYAGERCDDKPLFIRWDTSPGDARVKVWTDIRLKEAIDDLAERKIALLLEPPAVNPGMYEWIVDNAHHFAAVLTHQESLVNRGHPFLFYPFGGSWIRAWGMFPKSEMVSMLVSDKKLTKAHKLRHKAAKLPQVDSYGNGVGRHVESKADALRAYRFAVVIENDTSNHWFTEKLIDCLSQGTVPVYRGCSTVGRFFNMQGFIRWQDLEELEVILKSLTEEDYNMRISAIEENLWCAQHYDCAEDWIAMKYPELFEAP